MEIISTDIISRPFWNQTEAEDFVLLLKAAGYVTSFTKEIYDGQDGEYSVYTVTGNTKEAYKIHPLLRLEGSISLSNLFFENRKDT